MSELALYQLEGISMADGLQREWELPAKRTRKKRKPTVKSFSSAELAAVEVDEEEKAPTAEEEEEAEAIPAPSVDSDGGEEKGLYKPDGVKKSSNKRNRNLLIGGGGGAVFFGLLIVIIMLAGSLKVIHFSQVLTAAGYARVNGIIQERTGQDIFDSSAVEGAGRADLGGRTLYEKLTFKDVTGELSKMGREGTFKLTSDPKTGDFNGFKVRDQVINVDEIAQKQFNGRSFKDLSFGERLTVRAEFVDKGQLAIAEDMGEAPKIVRSRATSIVADNVGFSWARWRQALRKKFGTNPDPVTTDTEDRGQLVTDELKQAPQGEYGESLDAILKDVRDPARLKSVIQKKGGGNINLEDIARIVEEDSARASTIGTVATTASTAALILSISCMAHQTFAHVDDIANANEKQASLAGLTLSSAGSQGKKGEVTGNLMATAARQIDGAENAPDYQKNFGHTGDINTNIPRVTPNVDPNLADLVSKITSPSRLVASGFGPLPAFAEFLGLPFDSSAKKIDDSFCNAILSPEGIATVAVGGVIAEALVAFFSDGGSAIASVSIKDAAIKLVEELGTATWQTARGLVSVKGAGTVVGFELYALGLQYVATSLAGVTFSGANGGADYYENAYIGTNIVQNREVRSVSYGKPLTDQEVSQVDPGYQQLARAKWQQGGPVQRYLAIDNPYSLLGVATAYVPSTFSGIPGRLSSMLSNLGSLLRGSFLTHNPLVNILSGRAHAQTSDNPKDVTQWGFSPDELNLMRTDPEYSIVLNKSHLSDKQIQDFDSSIGKCFDPKLTQFEISKMSDCSAANLSGTDKLHYRVYKLDEYITNMSTGKEGDAPTTSFLGNGSFASQGLGGFAT